MALPNGDLITTVFDPQMAYPVDKRMQVDTLNSRDSMSMFIRWEGMEVYVLENSKKYILQGGRSNEYWKENGTGTGTGGTTFVGQFETDDLLPTTGRSAGDYAFVGTGEDFVQYNWDNISGQWVMAEGQTDMASEHFHIGYKTPLRRPVIFRRDPKDVIIEDSGDIIIDTGDESANFILTGEVISVRGIISATDGREIHLTNRSGTDILIVDDYTGTDAINRFNIGSDYTLENGETIALKSEDDRWILGYVNQVAFSDHLDSVGAVMSVGPDGLEVISGIKDKFTGEDVIFKEMMEIPSIVDGIIFLQHGEKYFQRSFTGGINPRWFNAKGNGLSDDTSPLQNAFLISSIAKLPVEFDESEYAVSTVDFKGCNVKFSNTKIKRLLSDVTTCELTGGEKIEGKLIVDGGGINATADLVTVRGKVSVDELEIINNDGVTGFYQDVNLLGSGVDFYCNRFYSKNGAYSGCSVHVGAQVDRIYINDYHCDNPKQKGFRVNGDVTNIYINNYLAIYRGSETSGTDGFLVDGGVGAELTPRVKVLQINNFYSEGFSSNGAKIQSTDTFICNNYISKSSENTTYAITLGAKNAVIGNLKISGHTDPIPAHFYSKTLNISYLEVETSSGLYAGKFNHLFDGDQLIQIGTLNMTGSTRTNGFFRTEYDGLKNAFIHIEKFISLNQRPINNSGLPLNKTGFIRIGELIGYTGTNYTGLTSNNNAVLTSPRIFKLTSLPTSGDHIQGDIILNPSSSTFSGWKCTESGNPGTWELFGQINPPSLDKYFFNEYIEAKNITSAFDVFNAIPGGLYRNSSSRGHFTNTPYNAFWMIRNESWNPSGISSQRTNVLYAYDTENKRLYINSQIGGVWGRWIFVGGLKLSDESSLANRTITISNLNTYLRFTGSSGTVTISSGAGNFVENDFLEGEIEGGDKTFAGDGVTLRYPDGQGLTAPTGSRFFIQFKSANDALISIIKPYAGFQLDENGNAVIDNTKKVGNGVANSENWIQYGNGATIYNVPTGQQHIFRQNGVAVAGISGDGKFFVEGVGKGIILKSPDGTQYEITVPNGGGSLTVTEI